MARSLSRRQYVNRATSYGASRTIRTIPIDANTFWAVVSSAAGVIAHRFVRNSGGTTAGQDAGATIASWEPWRHVSALVLSGANDNPASDTPLYAYTTSAETGAQNYAFQRTGATAYCGSYHGGETLTGAMTVAMDGVAFDPTAGAQRGNSLTISYSSSCTDGTITVTLTNLVITVAGATIGYALGSASISGGTLGRAYIGTFIASNDVWTETGIRLEGGAGSLIMLPNETNGTGNTYLNLSYEVRLRNPVTGRYIHMASNFTSAGGLKRAQCIRDAARSKAYFDMGAGTFGTKTNLAWSVTYGIEAAGATTFGANLLTNPAFTTDLTGWTVNTQVQTGGSITQSGGAMRFTRGTAGASRAHQPISTPLVSGARGVFLIAADETTSAGSRGSIGLTSVAGGGVSGAAYAPVANERPRNAHVVIPNADTSYFMALNDFTTGDVSGQTMDWDNAEMIKLAAAA